MALKHTPWGDWDAYTPADVARVLARLGTPWWLAGGYAIDRAVGRVVREHGDVDVLLLRRDQQALRDALAGWDLQAADPPGTLRPWRPGEYLPPGVDNVWCREAPDAPFRIDVLLDEASGDAWVSRRDPRVRRSVASLANPGADGVPYLVPEVQLFYKATNVRPKDQVDFDHTVPGLNAEQRAWLRDVLGTVHGDRHPWVLRLDA